MKVILWTKDVGSPNYVKSEGGELEDVIIAVHAPSSSVSEYESAEEFAEHVGLRVNGQWVEPLLSLGAFANRYAAERQPKRRVK